MLRSIVARIRGIVLRRRMEREMREEMDAHLERATERLIARGMASGEARLAARREFGNVTLLQEEGRRLRGGQWLGTVAADVRFAVRHFARTPLTSTTMIGVLSLGIAANVAVFGVVHALARRPAPGIPANDALVRIQAWYRPSSGRPRSARALAYPEFLDYVAQRQVFADVAGWAPSSAALIAGSADEAATPTAVQYVTGNYFDVLGVRLTLGAGLPRTPPDRLSPDLVAVISYRIWERVYGRSSEVLGRTIRVNDVPVIVVGVAPPRFTGPDQASRPEVVWLPLATRRLIEGGGALESMRADSADLSAVARLHPGIDLDQALTVVRTIAGRYPWRYHPALARPREYSTSVAPLSAVNERPDFETEGVVASVVFGVIALLILGVTCTTVSTLLVGAAVARRREIAVRVSLGASRGRILRQLLTESAMLAAGAALVSLAILLLASRIVQDQLPELDLTLHWEAVVFAFGFGIGTVMLFGLSPALHASRVTVADALKDSSGIVAARSRAQKTLVVAQIALSQPLLLGLVALVSLIAGERGLGETRPSRDRVIVATFSTFAAGLSRAQTANAVRALRDRVVQLPGVAAVVPYASITMISNYAVHPADRVSGVAYEPFTGGAMEVAPGYFGVLDIPVVHGREFRADDMGATPKPMIIGSDLARELWGTANPIGRRFTQTRREGTSESVVVGVVDSDRTTTAGDGVDRRMFIPLNEQIRSNSIGTLYIRTVGTGTPLIPTISQLARAEAPRVPLTRLETLAASDARANAERLRVSSAVAAGALLALLLSAIGLYAVVSFAVAQRTREIGIRIALGARQLQVVSAFFTAGLRLSLVGIAIGLPLGFVAVRFLIGLMDSSVTSLWLLAGGVAVVVVAVASLATWLPARRAAAVDPLIALRSE